jgi:hypothetical protein
MTVLSSDEKQNADSQPLSQVFAYTTFVKVRRLKMTVLTHSQAEKSGFWGPFWGGSAHIKHPSGTNI